MSYMLCPTCGEANGVVGTTIFQCKCSIRKAAESSSGADTGATGADIVLRALGDWVYQYPDRHLAKEHSKALELVSIYEAEERNPDERTKDTSKFSSGGY